MVTIAFDTLRFARALREKAKLTPEQAEGFADAIAEAMHDDLATKSDLRLVKVELQAEIQQVKAEIQQVKVELQAEIQQTKAELRTEIAKVRTDLQADIQQTKTELRTEIAKVRTDLESVKSELIKWMFGAVGFQTILMLGAVVALIRIIK